VTGRPSAVLDNDTQHVFARTPSGGLLHVWRNASQGMLEESIEGAATATCSPLPPLASDPVAAIVGGAQHVWGVDAAGSLQHLWWNPGQPWRYETWGEGLAGRPTIIQVGDAEHVFARSTAGAVQHWWWNPAQALQHDTWSGTVTIAGDPVAFLNGATQEVFALDGSGALQQWSWSATTGVMHANWGQ
jgi:hypothetical protein